MVVLECSLKILFILDLLKVMSNRIEYGKLNYVKNVVKLYFFCVYI